MNDLERQSTTMTDSLPAHPVRAGGSAAAAEIQEAPNLLDYWRVVKKHRWKIFACCVAAISGALIYVLSVTPVYTAWAMLLIEPKEQRVVKFEEMLSEPIQPGEDEYYESQFEMLKSRSLAAEVIKNQQLDKHPIFTGAGRKQNFVQRLFATIRGWCSYAIGLIVASPVGHGGYVPNPYGVASAHIDTYQGMLEVRPVKRSRLVMVGFNTPDPLLAASVANAHAEAYVQQGIKLRGRANQDARRFLESKLAELKQRVEKSEHTLNVFRRGKGIISLDDKENTVVDRLADLNRRLTEAEVARIGLESQAQLIKRRDYDSLPGVINNSLIQNLKGQLVNLEGQYANLAAQYKSGYPPVAKLKAQIDDTRTRLDEQIKAVVEGINSAYMAAAANERMLAVQMKKQKAAALALKDAGVHYAILEREADTNRKLYDSVLERMREIGVTSEIPNANSSILDIAEVPRFPTKPRKKLGVMVAAFVGLLAGLGLAFIFEYLDNTLRTPDEVERYLGLPNLVVVPDYFRLARVPGLAFSSTKRRMAQLNGELYLPGKKLQSAGLPLSATLPPGAVPEAYRKLRTAVLLSRPDSPPKTILFTSGTNDEGKTVTTANSAIMFAQMGYEVLVIDADLYRPSCHRALRTKNVLGLTDFLAGQAPMETVIMPTKIPKLHILSRGSAAPNPTELVGSQKMRDSLDSLKGRFDFLLIDSPPVTPVSDAVLLSRVVDGVVFVVRGQKTRKHLVKAAVTQLRNSQAKILGVVLNGVDIGKEEYRDLYHPSYAPDVYYGGNGHGEKARGLATRQDNYDSPGGI
jgi:capsular exopolysaccharide synthesis family protein